MFETDKTHHHSADRSEGMPSSTAPHTEKARAGFWQRLFGRRQPFKGQSTNTPSPTSIRGRPPGYKDGDFLKAYPHSLVVCTDLPNSYFSGEEGKYWILANRNIAIGSFLGIQSREQVDAYMAKLKVNTFICADCSVSEIESGEVDRAAIRLVSDSDEFVRKTGGTVGKRKYRIVPMLCEDAFKKTSWVRYCWFFD